MLQSLQIRQGEELAGMEPCALTVTARDHQRGHLPPLQENTGDVWETECKGANLCF